MKKPIYRFSCVTGQIYSYPSKKDAAQASKMSYATFDRKLERSIIDKSGDFYSENELTEEQMKQLKKRFNNLDFGEKSYNRMVYAYDLDLKLVKLYDSIRHFLSDNPNYNRGKIQERINDNSGLILKNYYDLILTCKPIDPRKKYKIVNEKVLSIRNSKKVDYEFETLPIINDQLEIKPFNAIDYIGFEAIVEYNGLRKEIFTARIKGIEFNEKLHLSRIVFEGGELVPFFTIEKLTILKVSLEIAGRINTYFENFYCVGGKPAETAMLVYQFGQVLRKGFYPKVPYFDIYNEGEFSLTEKSLGKPNRIKAEFSVLSKKRINEILKLKKDLNEFVKRNENERTNKKF